MRPWLAALLAVGLPGLPFAAASPTKNLPTAVVLDRPRTEPSVAIDPRNARLIVVAVNPTYRYNARGQEPVGIFVSRDGGKSWAAHDAPAIAPYAVASDPSVSFAPSGTLYVAYEAVSGGFCGGVSRTAVLVTHSTDQGRHFSPPVVVDSNADNDKPYMTAAAAPGGKGDAVYVAWIRFGSNGARIAFARSLDGGRGFTAASVLSSGPGVDIAPQLAALPDGRVYVGWVSAATLPGSTPARQWLETRASPDGGAHFGAVGRTPSYWGLPGLEQPGSLRLFNGPSLAAADPRHLYLAWSQARVSAGTTVRAAETRADIVLSQSTDGGLHWGAPVIVNDSDRGDRFEPQVAVAGDGTALVVFYDRRRDGKDLDIELAAARDTVRGSRVGKNIRLTAVPAPLAAIPFIPAGSPCLAQGRFFGDYIGLAARGNHVAVAWTGSESAFAGQTDARFMAITLAAVAND